MFFALSKIFSAITQPLFWLGLWWLAALLLLRRKQKIALGMLWSGLVMLVLLGFQAVPDMLLRSLEQRHAALTRDDISQHAGIIVLGGATGFSQIYHDRGQVPLGEAAERLTLPVGLMRQNPDFTLVFSGGEGRLLPTGTKEAELVKALYIEMGVDMRRVKLESGSRNTRENAQKVAALLGAACRKPWLLVTSASHMPRAMAEFAATGCQVTPYPVDYWTSKTTPWTEYSLTGSLARWQTALHEWVGLAVYAVTRQD